MVNNDIIKIKCPWCGSVLSVKNRPDIETKNVTCPVCKQKSAFTQFTLLTPVSPAPMSVSPAPQQPVYPSAPQQPVSNNQFGKGTIYETNTPPPAQAPQPQLPAQAFGELVLTTTGTAFPLHQGRNIVGRKSPGSTSDIQIETGASRRMSRQHLVIDVEVDPLRGVSHTISLYKEACNAVLVDGQALLYGDRIVIVPGMTISMPDALLTFRLPDPEKTIL